MTGGRLWFDGWWLGGRKMTGGRLGVSGWALGGRRCQMKVDG